MPPTEPNPDALRSFVARVDHLLELNDWPPSRRDEAVKLVRRRNPELAAAVDAAKAEADTRGHHASLAPLEMR